MTVPLPAQGDTSWYDWAGSVQSAAAEVATGRLTDATLTAAYGTRASLAPFVSKAATAVSYSSHLSRASAKLAQAPYRRFDLTGMGHSVMFGYWANDNASASTDPNIRRRGYFRRAQRLANTRFGTPDPGEGVITMADSRVTQSGASAIGSIGITAATPGGYRMFNNAAAWVELSTVEPCTEVWIHGWQQTDAECQPFQVQIDGGTATTVTTAQGFPTTGSDLDYTVKLTGLANTAHTVRVLGANPNLIDLAGFSTWNDPTAGVAFHRLAVGGGYLNTTVLPMSNTGANPRSNRLTLGRPDTDLLVMQFGTNESSVAGEALGHTPTTYNTLLTDFVNYATTTFGTDVLLVSSPRRGDASGTYGETAFYNVHETLAAANSNVAHLDFARLPEFATYAAANTRGLMYDSIHQNAYGHHYMSLILDAALASLAPSVAALS